MAINDKFMLPKRVRTMEQMGDLLAAEQAELDLTQRTIAAQEKQLTISTSTYLLPRHERLFALPVNTTESLDLRRRQVVAKLQGMGTTTPAVVKDVAETMLGVPVTVIEVFGEYRVELELEGWLLPLKDGVAQLKERLVEIMPAHLDWGLVIPLIGRMSLTPAPGLRCGTSALPPAVRVLPRGSSRVSALPGVLCSVTPLPGAEAVSGENTPLG